MYDTIVAISSGNINQAISIIRVVGPEAVNIVSKIFTGKILENKKIEYGFIKNLKNETIDEVLVNVHIGQDNFVGEDTIEINAHGGIVVTNMILELILSLGARLANPGEFTRRAYLNGKISLIKAESINELIHSKTVKQQQMAISGFDKSKEKLINKFLAELEHLIGLCEINIDYPEYDDIPVLDNQDFKQKVEQLQKELASLVKTSESSLAYSKSLSVVIVGNPNAGKSALMNAILNEDKSIVTNIAGTTRDVVESEVVFNNFILKFKDTAGIRESEDLIEKIGIEKSWKELENADVVLHVIDSLIGLNSIDEEIIKNNKNKKYLQLWNKYDLLKKESLDKKKIYISAKNKDIANLENGLKEIFETNEFESSFSFNQRQTIGLKKCAIALKEATDSIEQGFTYDVIILNLHEAWEGLKEVLGNVDKDELLNSIFKNFCLGK